MKKRFLLLVPFLFLGTALAGIVKAFCPLCVVAVGTGFGFSRWFGVDDVITSIWIGGLLVALSIWTIIWLDTKNWNFKYQKIVIPFVYYLLTFGPLYYYDMLGHPLNTIFGIDKIIFGSVLGTIIFLGSIWFHNFLKIKNQGKQFFSYQKVVLPFLILFVVSIVLYFLI